MNEPSPYNAVFISTTPFIFCSTFVHIQIQSCRYAFMFAGRLAGRQAVTQADRYNCVIPYNSVYMNLVCDIVLMVGNKRDVYNIACCTCHIINL